MSLAQNVILQDYLDHAQQRDGDRVGLENLDDHFESVKASLLNLSADPNWPHYVEETRVTSVQPEATGTIDYPTDGDTVMVGIGTLFQTNNIDDTYMLRLDGDDTEYPVESVASDTGLTLKYPFINKGVAAGTVTNYKLIKREYLLPDDFRELLSIEPTSAAVPSVRRISPAAIKVKAQVTDVGGQPDWYSIYSKSGSGVDDRGAKVLRLLPYPEGDVNISYDLTYQRWPASLVNDTAGKLLNVDWPPELKNVLEKAIELEIARKNRDPGALALAAQELAKVLPRAEAASTEDANIVLSMFGVDEDPNRLLIRIDASNA